MKIIDEYEQKRQPVQLICCFCLGALVLVTVLFQISNQRVPSLDVSTGSGADLQTTKPEFYQSIDDAQAEQHWEYKSLQCNLIYIKLKKTASSTMGGITRGIAARRSEFSYKGIHTFYKKFFNSAGKYKCKVIANHTPHPKNLPEVLSPHLRNKTFLFTVVRNPKRTFISHYFHAHVSRLGEGYSDPILTDYISNNFSPHIMSKVMGSQYNSCKEAFHWEHSLNKSQLEIAGGKCTAEIMAEYDFIGITERLVESLVVLKNILGLKLTDILFIGNSKTNGGYDDLGFQIKKTVLTPAVQEALDSKGTSFKYFYDEKIWEAADKKLTKTIEHLGFDTISKQVEEFNSLQQEAEAYCKGRIHFPFNKNGNRDPYAYQDCYWNDNGCGILCLDEFIANRS
eukprot:snap_masked-scaffold_12-processed-gene-1.30-mRNA-1 protein AED:1.00 eAED:1.00 QI:0/-1/0/0/-1/1/1/0/396